MKYSIFFKLKIIYDKLEYKVTYVIAWIFSRSKYTRSNLMYIKSEIDIYFFISYFDKIKWIYYKDVKCLKWIGYHFLVILTHIYQALDKKVLLLVLNWDLCVKYLIYILSR